MYFSGPFCFAEDLIQKRGVVFEPWARKTCLHTGSVTDFWLKRPTLMSELCFCHYFPFKMDATNKEDCRIGMETLVRRGRLVQLDAMTCTWQRCLT